MQFSTAVFSTLLLAGLGAAQSTTFGTSPSPTVSSASHTTSTGSSSTSVASLVASLPQCALSCFAQAAATAGCSTTDFSCICTQLSKSTSATTQLGLCALGACPNANLTDLTNKAGELCSEVTSGGASASDLAAASSYVASAVNAASSTSTKSGNAAVRTEMPIAMGLMGAVAALAVAL